MKNIVTLKKYCLDENYKNRDDIIQNFDLKHKTLYEIVKDLVTRIDDYDYEDDEEYRDYISSLYKIIDNKNTPDKALLFLAENFDDSYGDVVSSNAGLELENRGYVMKRIWVKE